MLMSKPGIGGGIGMMDRVQGGEFESRGLESTKDSFDDSLVWVGLTENFTSF